MEGENETAHGNVESDREDASPEKRELSFQEKLALVNEIAKPMPGLLWCRRIYKLVRKASKTPTFLVVGKEDVEDCIRDGETGICILAGDVFPIEVMCHMPAICDDKNIPYCFVPSQADLGVASGIQGSTIMVLVKAHQFYQDLFDKVSVKIAVLSMPRVDL